MKMTDLPKLNLINEEAAVKFIEIDDIVETDTGQSVLGDTKVFLKQVLADTKDSTIPGAFSAVLNQRLTGKLSPALLEKK